MTMLPLAHAGHWALYVLYAVPVAIVLFSVVTTVLRGRRKGEAEDTGAGGGLDGGLVAREPGGAPDGSHSSDR
jgi:hypothetical protein